MKLPQEYLDKYETLKTCDRCKRELRAGEEVIVSKRKAEYIAFHKFCPKGLGREIPHGGRLQDLD